MSLLGLLLLLLLPAATLGQVRAEECVGIDDGIARLSCFDAAFTAERGATAPGFSGIDPGAGPDDARPNSERAAAAFDKAARELGALNVISFEALFAAPGASISGVRLAVRNVVNRSRDNFSIDDIRYTSTISKP